MATRPSESRHTVNGVELTCFSWPGDGPAVLLVHATGFHARVWDQVLNRLQGRRAIAVDVRGHGRSEKPSGPYQWRTLAQDLVSLMETLELSDILGVGHSMGGQLVARAAALQPERFRALLLVDPAFGPEDGHAEGPSGLEHVLRRKAFWKSPHEMFERFQGRAPFASWEEAVLRDYCEFGLLRTGEGEGWELACPPEVEAAVYQGAAEGGAYEELSRVTAPVRVLLGRELPEGHPRPLDGSTTHHDLFRHLPQAESFRFSQHSHFLPMEAPGLVAGHIDEVARGISS